MKGGESHTLTRRQLKRLNLPPGTMDAVLRLHEQEVAALRDQCSAYRRAADASDAYRRERDALQSQLSELQGCKAKAEALQQQLDDDRAQAERTARRDRAGQAARAALLARGANPKAMPLLMKALDLDALPLEQPAPGEGDAPRIRNEDAVLAELCTAYSDFFAVPQALPTPMVTPPSSQGCMLTAESLRGMDAAQINANWSTVKAALAYPDD